MAHRRTEHYIILYYIILYYIALNPFFLFTSYCNFIVYTDHSVTFLMMHIIITSGPIPGPLP